MKRKMRQRLLMSLALIAAMTVIPVSSSSAAVKEIGKVDNGKVVQIGGDNMISPQYINTATITADLSIKGNTAYVHASAAAKRVCHVNVIMRLQYKDGNTWTTKKSWIESSDSGFKSLEKSTTLTKRGVYRTYAIFDVAGEKLTYTSVTQRY